MLHNNNYHACARKACFLKLTSENKIHARRTRVVSCKGI